MSGTFNPLVQGAAANPLLDQQAIQPAQPAFGAANAQAPAGNVQWRMQAQPNGGYLILRSPANTNNWEVAGNAANIAQAQQQLRALQGLYGGQVVP